MACSDGSIRVSVVFELLFSDQLNSLCFLSLGHFI